MTRTQQFPARGHKPLPIFLTVQQLFDGSLVKGSVPAGDCYLHPGTEPHALHAVQEQAERGIVGSWTSAPSDHYQSSIGLE
jgi:hypothetical protein